MGGKLGKPARALSADEEQLEPGRGTEQPLVQGRDRQEPKDACAPGLLAGRLHDLGPLLGATLPTLGRKAHHGAPSRDRDDARDAELHGLLEGVIHGSPRDPLGQGQIEWRFALGGAMTPTRTLTLSRSSQLGWVGAVHRLRPCSADKVGDAHATPWLDRIWTDAGV